LKVRHPQLDEGVKVNPAVPGNDIVPISTQPGGSIGHYFAELRGRVDDGLVERAWAPEELGPISSVCAPVYRVSGDLRFLGSQLVACVDSAVAHRRPGGLLFASDALTKPSAPMSLNLS